MPTDGLRQEAVWRSSCNEVEGLQIPTIATRLFSFSFLLLLPVVENFIFFP